MPQVTRMSMRSLITTTDHGHTIKKKFPFSPTPRPSIPEINVEPAIVRREPVSVPFSLSVLSITFKRTHSSCNRTNQFLHRYVQLAGSARTRDAADTDVPSNPSFVFTACILFDDAVVDGR